MLKFLFPKLFVDGIDKIDIDKLKEMGIKGIAFDIDNTLVPNRGNVLSERIESWLKKAELSGIKCYLMSNNTKRRVAEIGELLNMEGICWSMKPLKRSYLKVAKILGLRPSEMCVVGDQLFTDILGANYAGMYSILVTPLSGKEGITVRFKRHIEKIVMKGYKA